MAAIAATAAAVKMQGRPIAWRAHCSPISPLQLSLASLPCGWPSRLERSRLAPAARCCRR